MIHFCFNILICCSVLVTIRDILTSSHGLMKTRGWPNFWILSLWRSFRYSASSVSLPPFFSRLERKFFVRSVDSFLRNPVILKKWVIWLHDFLTLFNIMSSKKEFKDLRKNRIFIIYSHNFLKSIKHLVLSVQKYTVTISRIWRYTWFLLLKAGVQLICTVQITYFTKGRRKNSI